MGGLTDEEKLGIFGEGGGAGGGGEGGEDGELHFFINKSVGRMAGRCQVLDIQIFGEPMNGWPVSLNNSVGKLRKS